MSSELELSELKPKLLECEISDGEEKILLENRANQSQLVLPKEYLEIIQKFNGEKNIEEIATELYQESGQVSFNSIIKSVHLLQTAGLIEKSEMNIQERIDDKAPHEQTPSLLVRPLLELSLLKRISIGSGSSVLFVLFSVFILTLFCYSIYLIKPTELNSNNFLQTFDRYEFNLLLLVAISSALFTFKSLSKFIMLILASGKVFGLSLKLNFYSISIGVKETSLYAMSNKFIVVLYGICSLLLYFIPYLVLKVFLPEFDYLNDILLVAILLTFIDLDPYRSSELTRLFYYFYTESQVENLLPYLKNNSFKADINSKLKFGDELRFIIYGVISFIWAIGFVIFSFDLLANNLSKFAFAIFVNPIQSKVAAGYLTVFILFFFLYLSIDLLQTILKNLFSPIKESLSRVKSKGKKINDSEVDHRYLIESLKKNHLFSDLRETTLEKILDESELKSLSKGTNLINQGAQGEEFYVLISGSVEVNVKTDTGKINKVAVLEENTVIGEQAILNKTTRNANIVALEKIVYLEVKKDILEAFAGSPEFEDDYKKLLLKIEISQFISSSNLFKDFPSEIMGLFISAGDLVNFPAGHEIVTQGELDKTFYLIIRGKSAILKDNEEVASLSQGDFFGEIALIANTPRTATVKIVEDSLLLYIEGKKFWQLLSKNLDLAMYIESVGRQRMNK